MKEKQYKELLEKLNIGENRSNAEIRELLSIKLDEYLNREDEAALQMQSDIQDAMDYVEELIEKIGSGIALPSEELKEPKEKINRKLLEDAAKKNKKGADSYTPVSAAGGQAGSGTGTGTSAGSSGTGSKGKPWFYSINGDNNIDNLFGLAEGDLQIGDFHHAASVFDIILRSEMANAGAYMGKVLVKYKLQEPKDIATCYVNGLENDGDLKRAENCGNPKQKQFIQDALEERRKGMIYKDAETILQTSKDSAKLLQAAADFASISTYRDASQKADDCRSAAQKVKDDANAAERARKRKEAWKRKMERRKKLKKIVPIAGAIIIGGGILFSIGIDGMTSGGGIGNLLKFGDVHIDGNQEKQDLDGYPNIKTVTMENAADVYVNNCTRLKELTIKEADKVTVYAAKKTEKIDVDSVEELTLYGWGEEGQLEDVQVSNVTKAKISTCYDLRNWDIEEGIEELELYGCNDLSDVVVGKDVKDMTFRICNEFEGMSFEDEFSGKITFDICDVEKIVVPSRTSEINISICDSLADVGFADGFAGDISIDGSESLQSIFVPKETKSVFFRSCPELTNITFEEGFAGDIYVELCSGLTSDNFVIPDASENVTIRFCENLEDYFRHPDE